jgi:hypothetical protein
MRLLINNRHSSHSYSLRHFSVLVDILCQPIAADICRITVAPHRVALFPDFSFGTDFNAIKQVLLLALSRLGDPFLGSQRQLATLIWASLTLPATRKKLPQCNAWDIQLTSDFSNRCQLAFCAAL